MSSSLKIDTRVRYLKAYLDDFEKGAFQIPSFQRDFLWTQDDIIQLFDSIVKSYPIGSILFWSPRSLNVESISKIGPYTIIKKEVSTVLILDGYQRLSTLFGCLTNPEKYNKERLELDKYKWKKIFNIFYDLDNEEFVANKKETDFHKVPLYIFMNSTDFRQYSRKYIEPIGNDEIIERYLDRGDALGQIFTNYQIASVDIQDAEVNEAVEIFRRINEKGLAISKDWIVSALTINGSFRLQTEIDELLELLRPFNFGEIKRDVLFQCIQNSFGKLYYDVKIEEIVKRSDFQSVTSKSISSVLHAVKFLYEHLLVLNSSILPYNNQLIYISSFFFEMGNRSITEKQIVSLKRWFWATSYSNYFTIYSMSNQRKAYEQFSAFIKNENIDPLYYGIRAENPFSALEFPEKISMGSVRSKALALFMLNYSAGIRGIDAQKTNVELFSKLIPDNLFFLPKKENPAENYYPWTNDDPMSTELKRTKKDVSLFTTIAAPDENRFISQAMIGAYNGSDESVQDVLAQRKALIMEAECLFVEGVLGIDYPKS